MLYSMFLYCFSIPTDVVAEIVSLTFRETAEAISRHCCSQKKSKKVIGPDPGTYF